MWEWERRKTLVRHFLRASEEHVENCARAVDSNVENIIDCNASGEMVHHNIISEASRRGVGAPRVRWKSSLRALVAFEHKTWLLDIFFSRKENQLDAVKKSVTFETCCEQELEPKRVMKKIILHKNVV